MVSNLLKSLTIASSVAENLMEMDPGAMTEEQQLEWALRLSLQEGGGAESISVDTIPQSSTTEAATSAVQEEVKMETNSAETEENKTVSAFLGCLSALY